jgi:RNA polymerase sigma-70 factor (ECF subfamily)
LREQRSALINFLVRRTATREDAEDAAQESLSKLVRYRGAKPAAWKPLLYQIARNVAIDLSRRARTHPGAQRDETHRAYLDDYPSEEPTPEQCVERHQQLTILREAILSLPPRCREVYLLNRMQGMSFVQIARHLSISTRAVEKHVAKALVQLRDRVGKRIVEPL